MAILKNNLPFNIIALLGLIIMLFQLEKIDSIEGKLFVLGLLILIIGVVILYNQQFKN